jgi:hypothetical protein
VEQKESEGLDTAKPALSEEESKPASPESTTEPETASKPNIDKPKPMAPKTVKSSNNVDPSCANVEIAESFQLYIRKVTNQTNDSSGDPNKPRENAGTPETSINDGLSDFCCELEGGGGAPTTANNGPENPARTGENTDFLVDSKSSREFSCPMVHKEG